MPPTIHKYTEALIFVREISTCLHFGNDDNDNDYDDDNDDDYDDDDVNK